MKTRISFSEDSRNISINQNQPEEEISSSMNISKQIKLRKELEIEDKKVIGHIGRFCFQKNQEFLVGLLYEIRKKKDTVLLPIGEGNTENVKTKAKELGVLDCIYFLEPKTNANEYYHVMDCFVLCSTEVPEEARITDLAEFISLDETISRWVDKIKRVERKDTSKEDVEAGYDITVEAKNLWSIMRD